MIYIYVSCIQVQLILDRQSFTAAADLPLMHGREAIKAERTEAQKDDFDIGSEHTPHLKAGHDFDARCSSKGDLRKSSPHDDTQASAKEDEAISHDMSSTDIRFHLIRERESFGESSARAKVVPNISFARSSHAGDECSPEATFQESFKESRMSFGGFARPLSADMEVHDDDAPASVITDNSKTLNFKSTGLSAPQRQAHVSLSYWTPELPLPDPLSMVSKPQQDIGPKQRHQQQEQRQVHTATLYWKAFLKILRRIVTQ